MQTQEFGWVAYVTADDGSVLLGFPWTDHADQVLVRADSSALPVNVDESGWDDLDQGWWAHVAVEDSDVYVAETDLDAIDRLEEPYLVENAAPGVVLVNGVEVRWNVVGKLSWDEAWLLARESCRRGNPEPVGDWADERADRLVMHAES